MPLLGYWAIRGLAQPIRMLLGFAGEEFEEKRYDDLNQWFGDEGDKQKLGLDFPNLPYYVDGATKLSQSSAILRHLARKYDLCGKTDAERDRCDLAAEQVIDFRRSYGNMCYGRGEPYPFTKFRQELVDKLQPFEKFLSTSDFLAGNDVTWADFMFWEVLDQLTYMKPGYLEELPKLKAYYLRFKELPKMKKFMESDKFFVGSLNSPIAKWGGSYPVEPPQ